MRLNKYLVDAGVCSRREGDRLIIAGLVTVNGVPAVLGLKVDGTEEIIVKGRKVGKEKPTRVYIAYHKPVGIICTSDKKANDNIINAIHYPERIFHIGRLDVASSGLILLTNDGEIVNKILRAEGKHDKEYVVTIDRTVTPDFLKAMAKGVEIDGRKTLSAKTAQVDDKTFSIVLVEGRNRQIRRMCEALSVNVVALQRIRVMNIELGKLKVGTWRHLTDQEEQTLMASLA